MSAVSVEGAARGNPRARSFRTIAAITAAAKAAVEKLSPWHRSPRVFPVRLSSDESGKRRPSSAPPRSEAVAKAAAAARVVQAKGDKAKELYVKLDTSGSGGVSPALLITVTKGNDPKHPYYQIANLSPLANLFHTVSETVRYAPPKVSEAKIREHQDQEITPKGDRWCFKAYVSKRMPTSGHVFFRLTEETLIFESKDDATNALDWYKANIGL